MPSLSATITNTTIRITKPLEVASGSCIRRDAIFSLTKDDELKSNIIVMHSSIDYVSTTERNRDGCYATMNVILSYSQLGMMNEFFSPTQSI